MARKVLLATDMNNHTSTIEELSFPHCRTALYTAAQELHLLTARLERAPDTRLYVSELRRLTLRAALDVVSAGMASTPRSCTRALEVCAGRLAKVSTIFEVMREMLPRLATEIERGRDLCAAITRAFITFPTELAEARGEPQAVRSASEPLAQSEEAVAEKAAPVEAASVGISIEETASGEAASEDVVSEETAIEQAAPEEAAAELSGVIDEVPDDADKSGNGAASTKVLHREPAAPEDGNP